jgi:hypothetical protein
MAEVTLTICIPASKINDTMPNVGKFQVYGYLNRICSNSQIFIIQKRALLASSTDDTKTVCTGGITGSLQVLTNLLK